MGSGREIQEVGGICVPIADAHFCIAGTNITL